jgi:hypothetical protein
MKISFLMPTLFPELARPAIDALRLQLRDVEHEFVVVSPARFDGDGVVWIEEVERKGSVVANQRAFEHATGDVVLVITDDFRPGPGLVAETLTAFADPARPFPLALAFPHRMRAIDCVFTAFGRLYPTMFATGRADAAHAGGLFDPAYRQAFADPDFGMRVWKSGGRVRAARAHVREIDDRQTADAAPRNAIAIGEDWERFRRAWGPQFDPIWLGTVEDACQMIAACALQVLSPGSPDSLHQDGRSAAREIRIVRAMTLVAYHNNATISPATIEAGLKYFTWAAKLSGKPLQIYVADWYRAGVTLPPG